ncbi:MAG TPA: RidA family protein [Stellaceae bacterium]|nr:RidA family protein [Stellaceae bacterium]
MTVTRQKIQPESLNVRRIGGRALYSHVVTVTGGGRQVFIAGQLARDKEGNCVGKGDMGAQIEQVGRNIEACLKAAGASLSDIVKTTTFVTDIEEFFRHNEVRMRYLGSALPTSTTVEVRRLAGPDFMVEIEAIAVVD